MKFTSPITAILLATTACSSIAYADDASFEEIVVSATRYEQNLSNIGSSISVINADDLAQSQTVFVQDILQSVPGVTLNQNGSFGGISSVRVRGASSEQTVILLDGVQINDTSSPGGGFNFANLDPNGIEQIEVLRGPQSILYGSDAIGGVINILTPTGADGLQGSLYLEGGAFDTFRAGGNIAGGTEKLNFSLSAGGITTDGISKADENNGNSEKDGYRNISLHGKVTGKITENHSLQLISRFVDNKSDFDGFGPADANLVGYGKEFLIAGRGFFNYLDGSFQNTISVEYTTTDRRNETNDVEDFTAEGNRLNLDYFGYYKMNDNFGLSFGLQHEEVESKTASPEKFNIDSLFSEVSFQGFKGLTVTAGLRYDDHNRYGHTTTPRLTAAYFIEESGSKFFANWGEGFKAPTVYQLTYICGFCGLTEPNTNLKPEESKGWELGFEQAILEEKIQFGVTYFNQKITNMIDFDFSVGYGNIGNVHTKGIELFLDAEITDYLALRGNYTFTDAKDKDSNLDLVRVPRNAAFAEIQLKPLEKLNLAMSMTYNGKESDPYTSGTESWTRFDLKAAYEISQGIEIYGRIDNLFNREYQQINGYGTPDRSAYIGVRGKF